MPENFAHIVLFLDNPENVEDITQEVSGRSKDGVRTKLVVRVADTDGAICAQTVKTAAAREKLKGYPKLRPYEAMSLPRWQGWWKRWRRNAFIRKKMHADRCLLDAAIEGIVLAMRCKRAIALEPHPPAPLRLLEDKQRYDVLEMTGRARGAHVCIYELDGILEDPHKVLACVA